MRAREISESIAGDVGSLNELARKMAYAENILYVLKRFAKSFLVFEAVILALGLIGVPLMLWDLNQFWPYASGYLNSSIDGGQNKLFIASGIAGLVVSTFFALKDSNG